MQQLFIATTSEMLYLFWESWSRFKFSPHILLSTMLDYNWWQLCERFVHATVGREALWPLWGCYISCHLYKGILMLPWTRHWDPIHTISGHNVLTLYFFPMQTKIFNHSMLKSMGIFISNPCDCLSFLCPCNFLWLTHKILFSFAATSEMQLCSLFWAKPELV